jgi:hypothetical protein
MPFFSETGSGDESDVSGANHTDVHLILKFPFFLAYTLNPVRFKIFLATGSGSPRLPCFDSNSEALRSKMRSARWQRYPENSVYLR